jgi:hypothetical protein
MRTPLPVSGDTPQGLSRITAVIHHALAEIASSAIHRSALPHVQHSEDTAAASRIDRMLCAGMPIQRVRKCHLDLDSSAR